MNRLHNCKNPYQGQIKKVLCVCSAGLLRSPTAAVVLSAPPFNLNTRAAGLDEDHALIAVDDILLEWADEVVCMSHAQELELQKRGFKKRIISLDLSDSYEYRDPLLMKMIAAKYEHAMKETE